MKNAQVFTLSTPVGVLCWQQTPAGALQKLWWMEEQPAHSRAMRKAAHNRQTGVEATPAPTGNPVAKALQSYFAGAGGAFTLPLKLAGTPFQQRVWAALQAIPYGQTVTYGQLAQQLGSSPRAVGGAVGANPVPIVVPCHRVMGASGALTGFSGGSGVATKVQLLQIEGYLLPHKTAA